MVSLYKVRPPSRSLDFLDSGWRGTCLASVDRLLLYTGVMETLGGRVSWSLQLELGLVLERIPI